MSARFTLRARRLTEVASRLAILSTVLVTCPTSSMAASPGAGLADGSEVSCHDAPGFRVAMRDRIDGLVIDIVVTPVPHDAVPRPCDMAVGRGAYRMAEVGASYLALGDRFLALDVGSGPDRRLRVFDLAERARLLDAPYDDGRFSASSAGFVYWGIGSLIRGGPCLSAYGKRNGLAHHGVGHALHEVSFSFRDGVARDTGRMDCTVTQADLGAS